MCSNVSKPTRYWVVWSSCSQTDLSGSSSWFSSSVWASDFVLHLRQAHLGIQGMQFSPYLYFQTNGRYLLMRWILGWAWGASVIRFFLSLESRDGDYSPSLDPRLRKRHVLTPDSGKGITWLQTQENASFYSRLSKMPILTLDSVKCISWLQTQENASHDSRLRKMHIWLETQ